MSEYQYYEFRAVDRPLGRDEMDELRDLSTRAEITPTSFTNTYSYGDFKGKPRDLMGLYFDAFVYVANWGTRRLMFRIPRGLIDVGAASEYRGEEALAIDAGKDHVVIEFTSEDEPDDDWIDGEEWMPSLISIRSELIRGDFRALYIGWLGSIGSGAWDEAEGRDKETSEDHRLEPPVPPGLAKLSAPLQELAKFLRIDDALIKVAAARSDGKPPAEPSRGEMARWVKGLSLLEKEAYLVRFLADEGDIPLRAELARRLRKDTAPKRGKRTAPDAGRRTVAQLLGPRDALVAQEAREAAELAAEERARLDRERAAARVKHLEALARREPAAWREVGELIAAKRPKDYDQAVGLLVDLREIAHRSGRAEAAEARIREIRRSHAGKPGLLKRLDREKLGG